ncbi:carbohydrate ABC transporter substrate-binding protein, CUT1 family [Paenibacillus sp. cl141a]|uniref:ABC transporter substrate-binding protein n=1 Tax=Paenibacillus TaxID=44249 RepID=UPI0008BA94D9|nr:MULTISPECIES: extracellular solute-binding protein [Paenibacillus]PCL91797.1 sugar transporter [Paenibacillus lautus]QOT08579.1 extracellular solute-binding protein [Paenibacillus sp. JNUCC-32]WFB59485.1 extracellular solute-binding protein [Paenibacillus sp. BR1-192]SEM21391.1 carbohydrate ABC transporter substrate-binding protein, CUT1 family [Paenibacillus sp. cl141a]GIP06224.1 ABC transporter substrate-binding protein [Paenibacillus lautus]
MKRFKSWSLLLLSVIMVFTLAACGGGGGNGSSTAESPGGGSSNEGTDNTKEGTESTEKIELSFWSLGTTNYEDLAKEYTKEHPNITFKFQNTSDQTAHHNNLTTALSAGSGAPDIFQLEIAFMERFINNQDKFYNLYDLGAKDLEGNYLEWKWKQATSVDGTFQLGLPTDIGPTVVYYRTDLAEQAGLPTDPDGFSAAIDSWDKFASVAKDFTSKTGKPFADLTDLVYNGVRDQSPDQIYFNKEDGSFIGDTNPQVRKAYDFTVKGIQEGWIGNWILWSPEWQKAINDGDFGVMLGPAWIAGTIRNAKDTAGKWQIAQLPEGAGNWGGSFLTLPKEGKHSKEAYEFISWVLNKENQLKSFKDSGLFPSIPAVYSEPSFTEEKDEFFGGQVISEAYAKSAERIKPVYYGPLHDQTDTIIKNALKNVLEKKADPQKEWESAMKQIKTLVDRS